MLLPWFFGLKSVHACQCYMYVNVNIPGWSNPMVQHKDIVKAQHTCTILSNVAIPSWSFTKRSREALTLRIV